MPGRWIAAVLVLLNALVWGYGATTAYADDPATPQCPTAPGSITSDDVDPIVVELRELRRENAQTCARYDDRADQAHDDAAVTVKAVNDLGDVVKSRGTAEHPLSTESTDDTPPTGSLVALSGDDRTLIADAYYGIRGTLWWALGGVAALMMVGGFVWTTRPDR